ncbi:MAG TPA: AAA family ATPase [Clostridia bacterium]|nr:AAA family ATPase [Clostridia bacterium]
MEHKVNVLIADQNEKDIENIRVALSHEERIRIVGECSEGISTVKLAKNIKPDVVLMDINMPGIKNVTPTEILTATIPNVLVIVTFDKGGKKNLKKAMSDGARDYIVKPAAADVYIDTILDLYDKDVKRREVLYGRKQHEEDIKPKIVSIFSTKGGVGKSTIATNIATALAQKTEERVALVDFDLQFGDVSVMLNLYPERTVMELVKDIQSLDKELLEDYMILHNSGVKVLPAPSRPEYAEFVTGGNVQRILRTLKESYKYIVVDMAPAFDDVNLATLDLSDSIMLLTTLDLPTIKNVKSGLHVMKTLNYRDDKIRLILNRYHRNFGINVSDLEKTTEKKISHIVPEDSRTIIDAVNKGKPFVLNNPGSSVTKSIYNIVDDIMGKDEKKSMFGKWIGK